MNRLRVEINATFWKNFLLLTLLIVFLMGLAGYVRVGFSSLMWADDYCFMSVVKDGDFLQSQVDTYTKVVVIAGNRYAATFLVSLLSYIGDPLIPFFPLITILTWFVSLTFVLTQLFLYLGQRRELILSALISALLMNIVLYVSPSHFQNIYWYAGIITYTTPLVIFTFLLGIFVFSLRQEINRTWLAVLQFFLAFFAVGFSETAATAFFVSMSLIILFESVRSKEWRIWKWSPVFGLLLGMILLVVSPSAHLRSSGTNSLDLSQLGNMIWMISTTFKFGMDFIRYAISGYILPVIVTVLSFGSLGYLMKTRLNDFLSFSRKDFLFNLFFVISIYLVVAASISPSVFAFSSYPNLRSQMVGTFFLFSGIALISFYNGCHFSFSPRLVLPTVLVVLIFAGVYVLRASWKEQVYATVMQPRREQWILRHEFTQKAVLSGEEYLSVPVMDSIETLVDFNPVCYKSFYGLLHVEGIYE